MSKKITVLMPVYNCEKYLKEAIDSILCQTFKDFEFLIINDGSTDSTADIVQSYKDSRINFVENEQNIGLAASLNRGIDLAKCEYIARMDADDISRPERLEKQFAFMEKNSDIDICGTWAKFFGALNFVAKYAETRDKIVTNSFITSPVAHPSIIFRKNSFNRHNLRYNPEFKVTQDYELWVKAVKYLKFANIQEVLLDYRINSNQLTAMDSTLERENFAVWKINLENLGIDFTEEELNFHCYLLAEKCSIKNYDEFINKSVLWLDKIIKANQKNKFYNEKQLIKQLKNKWFVAYKNLPEYNCIDFFLKPRKFKYLNLENKIRLLYKSFKSFYKGFLNAV